jgi:hypothetical protein
MSKRIVLFFVSIIIIAMILCPYRCCGQKYNAVDISKQLKIAKEKDYPNGVPLIRGNNFGVGYQPIIIVLPEGTNFGATAVISGDRRYVRYSGTPLFSGIPRVTTFTFRR